MHQADQDGRRGTPCLPEALKSVVAWVLAGVLRTPPISGGFMCFKETASEVLLRWQPEGAYSRFHLQVKIPLVVALKTDDRRAMIEAELPDIAEIIKLKFNVVEDSLQYSAGHYIGEFLWLAEVHVDES